MGGVLDGRDIVGSWTDASVSVRIGGVVAGNEVELTMMGSTITGRGGGDIFGFDCRLQYRQAQRELSGRLGGDVLGKSVYLQLHSHTPPLIAALVACAAYYYMEITNRSHSANSRGGGS
jgi:hypothetical protein